MQPYLEAVTGPLLAQFWLVMTTAFSLALTIFQAIRKGAAPSTKALLSFSLASVFLALFLALVAEHTEVRRISGENSRLRGALNDRTRAEIKQRQAEEKAEAERRRAETARRQRAAKIRQVERVTDALINKGETTRANYTLARVNDWRTDAGEELKKKPFKPTVRAYVLEKDPASDLIAGPLRRLREIQMNPDKFIE